LPQPFFMPIFHHHDDIGLAELSGGHF
jgi:hypothetical protein